VTLLPYNEYLLEYLREQKANNRKLILATASNIKYANAVSNHLGLFDDVLASDGSHNLSGKSKRNQLVKSYGVDGYFYAANSNVDLPIWCSSRGAILVDVPARVEHLVRKTTPVIKIFKTPQTTVKSYLRAIRIHQWAKNVLVFLPIVAAHNWSDPWLVLQACISFLVFGLIASSVYLLNDLFDLESDRKHPSKKSRPFAAGEIPILNGLILLILLLVGGGVVASVMPKLFGEIVVVYYLTTVVYSLWLKRVVLVDVLTLAGLYTIRVIAGAAATSIDVSFWLLAFSMFIFLSLAMVKRYSELLMLQEDKNVLISGRGYYKDDLESIAHFGIASGYAAVLVMCLYINSDVVKGLYRNNQLIWLVCPLLLFWICRVWLLARRNQIHDDPVLFSLRDRLSHWILALLVLVFILAKDF
jgi:4-hydroxybenzoate polyprenyltransferase